MGKYTSYIQYRQRDFFKPFLGFSFFPPGQEYEFKVTKGEYEFSSLVGLLGGTEFQTQVSGKFKIYSGETLLKEWDLTGLSKERWFSKKEILEIREQQLLRLVWESGDSYLFVGEPLLYQIEGFGFESQESRKPKSVILIVIDSARKDFFGSYGYPHSVTPVMDQMAKESVFFENPFANGNWTKPSMMSFFHSEYSSNLGLGNSWFSTKPYQRKVYYGKKETI